MVVQRKWVIRETRTNTYFRGMNADDYPICERLDSRTKLYKSEKSAKMAMNRIGSREYCDFVVEYIESKEVPDVPQPTGQAPQPSSTHNSGLVIVTDSSGWVPVFAGASPPNIAHADTRFASITLYCKRTGEQEMFGVLAQDGNLYSAGLGGGVVALDFFLAEYRKYLLPRVSR